MILRPYQDRAVQWLRRAVGQGSRAPLLVCPTGGGKTAMGAHVARGAIAKGGRVVWLAHRRELVQQAAKTLAGLGLDVGHGGVKASAPVQVASVQTLLARGEAPQASLVVFDEAHHLVADDWGRIATAYKDSVRIGLTATPERGDGRGLGDVFDRLIVAAQIKELIALHETDAEIGLVPCDVVRPPKLIKAGTLVRSPVEAYLEKAPPGSSAIVFAPNIKAARAFAEEFIARGINAATVEATTPSDERDETIDKFRTGKICVLCNVMVLTEGFDAPIAKVCILARGCGSAGLYLQMVGRVLRPFPGWARAMLLDLRGISHVHGDPDEERIYSLDGRGISRAANTNAERFCRVCGSVMPGLPGEPCEFCGTQAKLVEVPKVVGGDFDKFARFKEEDPSKTVARLSKWLGESRAKGHKDNSVKFKFKAVYGRWPSQNEMAIADAMSPRTRRTA